MPAEWYQWLGNEPSHGKSSVSSIPAVSFFFDDFIESEWKIGDN